MDTNAVVINVRMDLFGWGLEQVKGFYNYGDRFSVYQKDGIPRIHWKLSVSVTNVLPSDVMAIFECRKNHFQ